jgi:N-succinyldiaminopimelate aminotransferase
MPAYGPRTAHRLRSIPPTIFSEMSALAVRTGSLNLGQGFPDQDGPPAVIEAAVEALRAGRNQYAPGPGVPELREAVAAHQRRYYDIDLDASSQVVVTAGATEAIAAALLALTGPGDEVVLFEPYYDSYAACVALAGARRRTVTIQRHTGGWAFDPDDLAKAVTADTKAIVLNTPHNPTGTVFGPAELAAVAELAVERDLIVIADEVYEHLIFDGRTHTPIATLPGMRDRTITISSAGKTFSVTGWKIGWSCAPPRLTTAIRTVKQFLTYVNGAPFQPAVAQVLDAAEKLAPTAALQNQRDLLCDGLERLGYDVIRPQATYFATVDVGTDAVEFCRDLPTSKGVVAIPSSVFYDSHAGDRYVRFAFCKRPEVLEEALRRMAA